LGQKPAVKSKIKQEFAEIAKLDSKPSVSTTISSKIIEVKEVDSNSQKTDNGKSSKSLNMLESALTILLDFKDQQADELNVTNTKLKELEEDLELERTGVNCLNSQLNECRETVQKLKDEISSLKSLNQNLKSMSAECKICFSERISVALSCGHTICDNCFEKVFHDKGKKCPFCKQKYLGLQHLFLE